MSPSRWRRWLWTLLVLAGGIGSVHLLVEILTREGPNYSLIEPGLYLGGLVPEPPPGTVVVLNLCEAEDSFAAKIQRWVPIKDAEPAPDLPWLGEQVAFIDENRRMGRTILSQISGGSRSHNSPGF